MTNLKFQLERVNGTPVSNDEITADIRRVAELAGTGIAEALRGNGEIRSHYRFETVWFLDHAVKVAGLDVANEINYSDERLFENLMLLWEHYGRQPRRAELAKPPSQISQSAYNRRFRTWTNALERFVAYANSQDIRTPSQSETASGHQSNRDPSLRLRFRVMKRDNFSCRACGTSPALKPGLFLHVDHVTPWSRGGETIEDNLQTLCESCNLGKSNVL